MFEQIITMLDTYVWATPLIILIFASAAYFKFRMGFVQLRDLKFRSRDQSV